MKTISFQNAGFPARPVLTIRGSAIRMRPWDQFSGVLALLICLYLLAWAVKTYWLVQTVNLAGPVMLGAATVFTAYQLLRRNSLVVWTPFFWFLGAVVLFYVLGPLVYVLGSSAVVHYVASSLPILVTDEDLLKTNLLNCVGIFSVAIGVRFGAWLLPVVRKHQYLSGEELFRMKSLAVLLLISGGVIQFGLTLPWEFGVYDFVLPGVIYNLSKLFLFGLMTLSYLVAAGVRRWRMLLYGFWAVQLLIALIHFSKTEVMITILLPVLGAYMANRNLKRLVLWFLVMAVVYVVIAKFIHYGRHEVMDLSGTLNQATVSERLQITGRALVERSLEQKLFQDDVSSLETGWARLSYANVQTFVMDQYDRGWSGNTLEMVLYVFIPRFIWPDKPIMSDIGVDFYEIVTGRRLETTHLGLGIFGEGYWNFGWVGVVLLGLNTGIVFWFMGVFSMGWMAARQLEYMPSIFLGINMGLLGPTQFFANAIVGGVGYFVVYALIVSKVFSLVLARNRIGN